MREQKQIKWRTVYLRTTVNSTAPKNAIACAVWISQQQKEKLLLNMCTDALESAREVLFAQICYPMALECNLLKVIIAWICVDQLFSVVCALVFEAERFSVSPSFLLRI